MTWADTEFIQSKRHSAKVTGLVVHTGAEAPRLQPGETLRNDIAADRLEIMSFSVPDECRELLASLGPLRVGESKKGAAVPRIMRDAAVILYPGTEAMARAVPARGGPNRPHCGPLWWILDATRARSHGSKSQAFAENTLWHNFGFLYELAQLRWGPDLAYIKDLSKPPGEQQTRTFKERIRNPESMKRLQDSNTETSFQLSRALGRHLPSASFDPADIPIESIVVADGTYINSRTDVRVREGVGSDGKPYWLPVGSTASDLRRMKRDPTARYYKTGTKEVPQGSGLIPVTSRGRKDYSRVVHRTAPVGEKGGEAAVVKELMPPVLEASGHQVRAISYDKALEDVHKDQLLDDHGIITVSRMTKRAPGNKEIDDLGKRLAREGRNPLGTQFIEPDQHPNVWMRHEQKRAGRAPVARTRPTKYRVIGTVSHRTTSGACEHHLAVDDGKLWEIDRPDATIPLRLRLIPLSSGDLIATAGSGHYLRYQVVIDCPHGPGTIWIDTVPTAKDTNVRAVGYLRPNFTGHDGDLGALGKRSDSESGHGWYQDTLPDKRAAFDNPYDQQLDHLLGFGLATNAITWAVHAGILHPTA